MARMSVKEMVKRFFVRGANADYDLTSLNLEVPVGGRIVDDRLLTGIDRSLSPEERAVAEWLLLQADPPALDYVQQLDAARVYGSCGCGCPTIYIRIPEETPRGEERRNNPLVDAFGEVDGNMVGVMLFEAKGYITSLEVYDLSDITHPYGLPNLHSLRLASWDAPSL